MPAKNTRKLTHRKRAIIAAGKAVCKPNAVIAAEAGVGLSTVAHAAKDPRIAPLIERLRAAHEQDLTELYAIALREMRVDLASPVPELRLRSRDQVRRFIEAGERAQAAQAAGGDGPSWTWEEFVLMVRRTSGKAGAAPPSTPTD